jgi:hypothetical protein
MNRKELVILQIILLLIIISFLVFKALPWRPRKRRAKRSVHWAMPLFDDRQPFIQQREPEFRGPPWKEYKPPHFQQMGILTSPTDGNILPLYGKTTPGYRDRYNYYTSTPGNQMYALPIQSGDRDCTEDIGCNELYGNEQVSVTGMSNNFNVTTYQNKIFN